MHTWTLSFLARQLLIQPSSSSSVFSTCCTRHPTICSYTPRPSTAHSLTIPVHLAFLHLWFPAVFDFSLFVDHLLSLIPAHANANVIVTTTPITSYLTQAKLRFEYNATTTLHPLHIACLDRSVRSSVELQHQQSFTSSQLQPYLRLSLAPLQSFTSLTEML